MIRNVCYPGWDEVTPPPIQQDFVRCLVRAGEKELWELYALTKQTKWTQPSDQATSSSVFFQRFHQGLGIRQILPTWLTIQWKVFLILVRKSLKLVVSTCENQLPCCWKSLWNPSFMSYVLFFYSMFSYIALPSIQRVRGAVTSRLVHSTPEQAVWVQP